MESLAESLITAIMSFSHDISIADKSKTTMAVNNLKFITAELLLMILFIRFILLNTSQALQKSGSMPDNTFFMPDEMLFTLCTLKQANEIGVS